MNNIKELLSGKRIFIINVEINNANTCPEIRNERYKNFYIDSETFKILKESIKDIIDGTKLIKANGFDFTNDIDEVNEDTYINDYTEHSIFLDENTASKHKIYGYSDGCKLENIPWSLYLMKEDFYNSHIDILHNLKIEEDFIMFTL